MYDTSIYAHYTSCNTLQHTTHVWRTLIYTHVCALHMWSTEVRGIQEATSLMLGALRYVVAYVSRIDEIIGLLCKRAL